MSYSDPMNSQRYVGWQTTVEALGTPYQYLFKPETIRRISQQITKRLHGVHPEGKNIIYPDHLIAQIVGQVFSAYKRPNIGGIYTKDIIANMQPRDDMEFIINQSINIIATTLKTQLETENNNKKLSIWDSVLGDFNRKGLRAHPILKIKKNRPMPMMFNMNY
jgi:hypothetical protein